MAIELDVQKLSEIWKKRGPQGCTEYLNDQLNAWKKVPINIGVIGRSGVGKSSFINSIRGLRAEDDGAAQVGTSQTTMEPKGYNHPYNDNIVFWDLPGVGTKDFPRDTYLQKIEFTKYDTFLILACARFTDDDSWIGEEISKAGKNFYYVRTKVALDIENDKHDHPSTHNLDAVLEKIKQNIVENLGSKYRQRIYLIDNKKVWEFDFEKLETNIISELPIHKQEALSLSIKTRSNSLVDMKVKFLEKRIIKCSLLSATVAAIPIPGLSIVVDLGILINELNFFKEQLGLDDLSIKARADLLEVSKNEVEKFLVLQNGASYAGIFTRDRLKIMFAQSVVLITSGIVENVLQVIPILGQFAAGGLSYASTSCVLKNVLKDLQNIAYKINEFAALKLNTKCIDYQFYII